MSVIVRMAHLRRLGYCGSGVRVFFEKFNLDYSDFLKNGIDADTLLQACNNDYMAVRAVEVAHEHG